MSDNNKGKDPAKKYEEEYPENGDNFTAGKPDASPLPNNPAENAEKTSPEEDEANRKKEQGQPGK